MVFNMLNHISSSFYMYPNENRGAVLVSAPLMGENYHSWCRAVTMALKSKKNVQSLNGSLTSKSKKNDKCNTNVLSLMNRSLDLTIAQSVRTSPRIMLIMQVSSMNVPLILVKLFDGSEVTTNISGTNMFSNYLYLSNILYITSFSFNLISMLKLTFTPNCKHIFSNVKCTIHEESILGMISAIEIKEG
ncbi:hypothetical protein Lal_00028346, partial [Lupinus albus]